MPAPAANCHRAAAKMWNRSYREHCAQGCRPRAERKPKAELARPLGDVVGECPVEATAASSVARAANDVAPNRLPALTLFSTLVENQPRRV